MPTEPDETPDEAKSLEASWREHWEAHKNDPLTVLSDDPYAARHYEPRPLGPVRKMSIPGLRKIRGFRARPTA